MRNNQVLKISFQDPRKFDGVKAESHSHIDKHK